MNQIQEHWNKSYKLNLEKNLGWYEPESQPSISLIQELDLKSDSHILHVGCGKSNLTESLLELGFTNLTLTDISDVALENVKNRISQNELGKLKFINDDLTKPIKLMKIEPVDLWHDRAVLHFFNSQEEQDAYFNLLKLKVNPKGFVILAEFIKETGATKCSNLNVYRYDTEEFQHKLGPDFHLLKDFQYTYINPNGGERPYIYALFRRF